MTGGWKMAAIGVAALAVAGCQTLSLPKLSTGDGQAVRVAVDTYNVVEVAATQYLKLPECASGQTYVKNFCADRVVAKKVIAYGRSANVARNALVSFARANPNSTAVGSYVSALTAAVSVLKGTLTNVGVKAQ